MAILAVVTRKVPIAPHAPLGSLPTPPIDSPSESSRRPSRTLAPHSMELYVKQGIKIFKNLIFEKFFPILGVKLPVT